MGTIFYGKVISAGKEQHASKEQDVGYENNGEISYRTEKIRQIKFKVLRIWNGTPVEEITVGANAHHSCSLNAEVGDKLLLSIDNTKVLTSLDYVNNCSIGVISDYLVKPLLKKIYGEGKVVNPQKLRQKICRKTFYRPFKNLFFFRLKTLCKLTASDETDFLFCFVCFF